MNVGHFEEIEQPRHGDGGNLESFSAWTLNECFCERMMKMMRKEVSVGVVVGGWGRPMGQHLLELEECTRHFLQKKGPTEQ